MSEEVVDLKVSKKLKSIKIRIDDDVYELRELSGPQRDKWASWQNSRADKKTGRLKSLDGFYTKLIGMCLYKDGQPVPEVEINEWPASTQQVIFDKCDELSLLTVGARETAEGNS